MKHTVLRPAKAEDTKPVLDIYAPYVTETDITFEYEVPTAAEFTRRIREISAVYPYLIAEQEGQVAGYAYASRQKERAAYSWNAELSIYLVPEAKGTGAGDALYGTLLELLARMGIRTVYAVITHPNERSERFHKKHGFTEAGLFRGTGFKLGEWKDVLWMEKRIGPRDGTPAPLIPFPALPSGQAEEILRRYSL